MKITLSTNDIAHALTLDDANWSWKGALALAKYLEELEEDSGEEMELDVVAIRSNFSEYESLHEWAEDYFSADGWKEEIGVYEGADADDVEQAIREYCHDRGTLIEFDGGIIVSSF